MVQPQPSFLEHCEVHIYRCNDEEVPHASSLGLLSLLDRLEEPLQVLRLLLQEFDLFLSRFCIILALLVNDALDGFNLGLLLQDALLLLLLALFKLSLPRVQLSSSMLGLKLLAHRESH